MFEILRIYRRTPYNCGLAAPADCITAALMEANGGFVPKKSWILDLVCKGHENCEINV